MEIEFFNKYIDPTGKNILTPDALTEYLGNPSRVATVPVFCPNETFEIPIAIDGRVTTYARIIYGGLPRYYFVGEADQVDLHAGIINMRFSIDWAHTLRCGLTSRKFSPRSVLTRTTAYTLDAYEQDRSRLAGVHCLGNTENNRGFCVVGIYAVKRAGSLFTNPSYQYGGYITGKLENHDTSGNDTSFEYAMIIADEMMKAVSFKKRNPSTGEETGGDDCSPVAFYIVPAAYCPDHTGGLNITLYRSDNSPAAHVYQPETALEVVTKTIRYTTARQNTYSYEVGNNSKRVAWRSIPSDITTGIPVQTTFMLNGSPGEFCITANIDGNVLDLTESCAIPFVIANESEINVQVNKRNLSLLSAGVQIAGGVAGQNASMIYSGAMSAASSVADVGSMSFPSIRGSGNLYSDSVLHFGGETTCDILKIFEYDLTATARYKNKHFGSIGSRYMTQFPYTDDDFVYLEGDMFPLPGNYLEAQNLSRMKEIFDGGIRVYKTAAGYLS